MNPKARFFYVVQELIWAGWTPEQLKDELLESYKQVMDETKRDGVEVLKK